MSIHTLNRIYYVTTGVLVSLLAVFAVLLFFGQRELTLTKSLRYTSYLLADELRQSSDDLTRMARTYAVTGDVKFERMYWEILAIRNGEAPRPRVGAILDRLGHREPVHVRHLEVEQHQSNDARQHNRPFPR